MGDENFGVGDRVLTKSLPVCSEQLMSRDVFHRDKAKVIKEAKDERQWVLRRIHCANLLPEKRRFWEKKWGEWVMREDLDNFLPDIEALNALYSKHLPVEWDEMAVQIIELPLPIFVKLTGSKRTQKQWKPEFGWMGTCFEVGETAIVLLDKLGFYVHMENREKGKVSNVEAEFAEFHTKFTINDLVKAFSWMDVEGEAFHKPFYWTTVPEYKVASFEPLARRLILL
jgi:hypothetical protein